jgi:hypothetical protein
VGVSFVTSGAKSFSNPAVLKELDLQGIFVPCVLLKKNPDVSQAQNSFCHGDGNPIYCKRAVFSFSFSSFFLWNGFCNLLVRALK